MDITMIDLRTGNCLEVMRTIDSSAISAIVTDPPYALEFMGKGWDSVLPSKEIWREALRVLRPGGNMLVFGGTRTFHRLACIIEDSGFEIRDCLCWVYSSGFPKSRNLSIAIDKEAGLMGHQAKGMQDELSPTMSLIPQIPPDEYETPKPISEQAKLWKGYGTNLKPAWEPILLARKPIEEGLTIAANAQEHGVVGINVDDCRIGDEDRFNPSAVSNEIYGQFKGKETLGRKSKGRWPANFLHDGSDEVEEGFPQNLKSTQMIQSDGADPNPMSWGEKRKDAGKLVGYNDFGSASRFFYCSKASKSEKQRFNTHPTVKPLKLMTWLVCLVAMPEFNLILDPFMGSGTTALACQRLALPFIGIEKSSYYVSITRQRLYGEDDKETKKQQTLDFFRSIGL